MAVQVNVSAAQVNENKVRLNALWVFILAGLSIKFATLPIALFLVLDFFTRGFGYGKISPIGFLSDVVIKILKIGSKPIYFAPKQFAARIGFILSLVIALASFINLDIIVVAGCIILTFFAFLESFLGFCAGCYVYSFLVQLKVIRP